MRQQSYELGPYFCENPHHALLHHVLDRLYPDDGIALEFGVGEGHSLRCISRRLPVIGFDSFEGLPEDWRPGFEKGMFAYDLEALMATLPEHAHLWPGRFEEALPEYNWGGIRPIRLVHIDCDLYSSTKTVLENLPWASLCRSRAVIIFDEWWGYPEAPDHEQRAWKEAAAKYGLQWEVIGHGVQQWGIRLA